MTIPRVWVSGDYNQAESRVVAWLTPIPKLKQWYEEGVDVHARVCCLIAEVIQKYKIQTPVNPVTGVPLFHSKHYSEYAKGDEERELSKRTVHGSNYDMGIDKLALVLGTTEIFATIVYNIYHQLFPEIKKNYHTLVRNWLTKTRTIWMPEPVKFRKVFWGKVDEEMFRSAYSCYPQCVVGAMCARTIAYCGTIFRNDIKEELKDQWCEWYGYENWDEWRRLRDCNDHSPKAIRWSGFDMRLNVHDSGMWTIPKKSDLINWSARVWKSYGETPIIISPTNHLVIPIDFKTGPNAGDLVDLKL